LQTFLVTLFLLTAAGGTTITWQHKIVQDVSVDGRIVVTIANYGFNEWVQQWFVSAIRAGIKEVILIAVDKKLFDWARPRLGNGHVIHFDIDGSDGIADVAHRWRSKKYIKVVSQRARLLYPLVSWGFDIIYADTDIHWFKYPFPYIPAKSDVAVQQEKSDVLGDYNCSGFIFLRSSAVVLAFMREWERLILERVKKPGFFTDQELLNNLLSQVRDGKAPWNTVNAVVLSPAIFPSGIQYFFQRLRGRSRRSKTCQISKICRSSMWLPRSAKGRYDGNPVIVHHNYIKGNDEKILRAKKFKLWLPLTHNTWQ